MHENAVIITGGASGMGFAVAAVLSSHPTIDWEVHLLLKGRSRETGVLQTEECRFHKTNATDYNSSILAFEAIGRRMEIGCRKSLHTNRGTGGCRGKAHQWEWYQRCKGGGEDEGPKLGVDGWGDWKELSLVMRNWKWWWSTRGWKCIWVGSKGLWMVWMERRDWSQYSLLDVSTFWNGVQKQTSSLHLQRCPRHWCRRLRDCTEISW